MFKATHKRKRKRNTKQSKGEVKGQPVQAEIEDNEERQEEEREDGSESITETKLSSHKHGKQRRHETMTTKAANHGSIITGMLTSPPPSHVVCSFE